MRFRTALAAALLPGTALAAAPEWEAHPWSLGARGDFARLTDEQTHEDLDLGGVGANVRWRLSRRFSLEGSVDALLAQERWDSDQKKGTVSRATVPFMISGLFHLFPDSDFQIYGLMGLGVTASVLDYDELGVRLHVPTAAFQMGVGARLRLGENMVADVCLRGMAMDQQHDDVTTDDLPDHAGAVARNPDPGYSPRDGDRHLTAGMLTAGLLFDL